MEVNRKRTQVHRLPTENCENSKFGYIKRSGALHYFTDGLDPYHHLDNLAVPQHLYITSDEEIKEGDWCIDINNELFYVNEIDGDDFISHRC